MSKKVRSVQIPLKTREHHMPLTLSLYQRAKIQMNILSGMKVSNECVLIARSNKVTERYNLCGIRLLRTSISIVRDHKTEIILRPFVPSKLIESFCFGCVFSRIFCSCSFQGISCSSVIADRAVQGSKHDCLNVSQRSSQQSLILNNRPQVLINHSGCW